MPVDLVAYHSRSRFLLLEENRFLSDLGKQELDMFVRCESICSVSTSPVYPAHIVGTITHNKDDIVNTVHNLLGDSVNIHITEFAYSSLYGTTCPVDIRTVVIGERAGNRVC